MGEQKIVVRGVNWLGDSVMTMPALCRLRKARPDAYIALFIPEKLADIWKYSEVDEIITFHPRESLWQAARKLRARHFDTGLVLPFSFRSAFELWLAGIPCRIGYAHKGRSLLLTHPLPKLPDIVEMQKRSPAEVKRLAQGAKFSSRPVIPPLSHHIHRYLHLAAVLGADSSPLAPSLPVADSETREAIQKFGLQSIGTASPLFGMNPGAEYGRAKRWPVERFIAAAQEIQYRTGCRWILFGGPADVELTGEIACAIQRDADQRSQDRGEAPEKAVWDLAGATSLRELCVVLKLCSLLVTNDTGPMHLAAAVGTPVVAPFGSTSPALTGPGLPGEERHRLLVSETACSPCFLRECPLNMECMKSVSIQHVTEAVLEIFAA